MAQPSERWIEVTPSQFPHEAAGLQIVRQLLPDETPFRAWSNFEFRDAQGRWHEVDLLVLGRNCFHLVELKYYNGRLRGDDLRWVRAGHPVEDSPLLLARRKAQRLASRLTQALRDWANEKGQRVDDPRRVIPFIQESVFLHHPGMVSELPPATSQGLYGLDDHETSTGLPGISTRLFEPAGPRPVPARNELILTHLLERIGLKRRLRTAGAWTITKPLADGEGWQDWAAHHTMVDAEKARVRFRVLPAGTADSETTRVRRLAEHEFRAMSRLHHDGILRPKDLVESEVGIGLVYDDQTGWQRLDLWLAAQPGGVALTTQLAILRQIAEAIKYAHGHRLAHRDLSPSVVWVRAIADTDEVRVRVGPWPWAGQLDSNQSRPGVTSLWRSEEGPTDASAQPREAWVDSFRSPESPRSPAADRVRIDVFGLGALAHYLLTGRPPASSASALVQRLRDQQGIDPIVELPQISADLRELVLTATHPAPSQRLGDVDTFLSHLDNAEQKLNRPSVSDIDPLDAAPGAMLNERFELKRRLGQGSTAVGLLVHDHAAAGKDSTRVLKVALSDAAAGRLTDEADVLRLVRSDRIVKLVEGPVTIGGRQALVLESAGEHTLAAELHGHSRLSLDLLDRFGTDLLEAVVALDRAGIDHRDIKPANLGVRKSRSTRAKHLVLFDFSLTRAAAAATTAGTPPYLDPFLGGARDRFDSAAERYAAAVVLFEMATGAPPRYGADPDADPATVRDEATVTADLFDESVAPALAGFFTTALARDATHRHHTAEDMLAEWRGVFPAATTQPGEHEDELATAATLRTPLRESGLTARALSALEDQQLQTVGDLLAVDPVRLTSLRGVTDNTRKHIRSRIRQWRQRLGDVTAPKAAADRSQAARSLTATAEALVGTCAKQGRRSQAALARLVLGYGTSSDPFATNARLGALLPEPVSGPRVTQLFSEQQQTWASDRTALARLGELVESLDTALAQHGDVLTPAEAAAAIARSFGEDWTTTTTTMPTRTASRTARDEHDTTLALGLLRLTLERIRQLRKADETSHDPIVLRRREGQVVLLARSPELLDVGEWLAERADTLVATAGDPTTALVPAGRVAEELTQVFTTVAVPGASSETEMPAGSSLSPVLRDGLRLASLGAAVSRATAATAAGDLHHRDLGQATALALTFRDVGSVDPLPPHEIRNRVHVRFPALPELPQRPRLDQLIREAQLPLVYNEGQRKYVMPGTRPDTTGLEYRQPTATAPPSAEASISGLGVRLAESVSRRSFLALGVRGDRLDRFIEVVRDRYAAHELDLTGVLLDELKARAAANGLPWEAVTAADAETPTSQPGRGLALLVEQSWPAVVAAIETALAEESEGPVLLTEAAPLARYGNTALLARWSDLGVSRPRAIWLVLPQLMGHEGPLLDDRPVPLGAPSQFVRVRHDAVDELNHDQSVTR